LKRPVFLEALLLRKRKVRWLAIIYVIFKYLIFKSAFQLFIASTHRYYPLVISWLLCLIETKKAENPAYNIILASRENIVNFCPSG